MYVDVSTRGFMNFPSFLFTTDVERLVPPEEDAGRCVRMEARRKREEERRAEAEGWVPRRN